MSQRRIVPIGARFNRLTVMALAGPHDHPQKVLLCKCDCGTVTTINGIDLVHSRSKSCGCLKTESARKLIRKQHDKNRSHGRSRTRIYKTWVSMIQRCANPRNGRYDSYGGRGIAVCERWQKFENFLTDMGERPQGKSLDRINNEGNYEPRNCRWATAKQQQRNARRTTIIEYRGENYVFRDLCDRLGLDHDLVKTRIDRGWPIAEAIEKPATWTRKVKAKP